MCACVYVRVSDCDCTLRIGKADTDKHIYTHTHIQNHYIIIIGVYVCVNLISQTFFGNRHPACFTSVCKT